MSKRYVYVVECAGVFKVGIATNVKSRISSLQTGCPGKITPVACLKVDAERAREIERAFHAELRQYYLHGEWFECPRGIIDHNVRLLMADFGVKEVAPPVPQTVKQKRFVEPKDRRSKWDALFDALPRDVPKTPAERAAERRAERVALQARIRSRAKIQMAELAAKKRAKAEALKAG